MKKSADVSSRSRILPRHAVFVDSWRAARLHKEEAIFLCFDKEQIFGIRSGGPVLAGIERKVSISKRP